MADYWKSQARKFCDFCKCWIADNKPSIDFHENGKKHKENVQKRLKDIHKKSAKDAKAQRKFESDIDQMEKAAMAAYLKDVQSNTMDLTAEKILREKKERMESGGSSSQQCTNSPPLNPNQAPEAAPDTNPRYRQASYGAADVDPLDPYAAQKLARIEARDKAKAKKEAAKAKNEEKEKGKGKSKDKSEPSESKISMRKVWYEAKSQGHSYYWNIDTNESVWEPPLEGYMSIEEQAEEAKEQALQEKFMQEIDQEEAEEKAIIDEERRANAEREKLKEIRKRYMEKNKNDDNDHEETATEEPEEEEKIPYRRDYSVPIKPQPYGAWQVVKKVEQKPIDWQLPKVKTSDVVLPTFSKPAPVQREFKEKTITSISTGDSDDEDGSNISFKRRKFGNKNVRKRTTDD